MKRFATVGLLIVLLICAVAAQGSVKLQYKFTPGQLDTYKLVMDMKMNMPGMPSPSGQPMNMKMSMLWTQKVLGVLPDGSAKIKLTYKDMKMSMPGMPPSATAGKLPKDASIVMVMGRDGKVLKIEGMEKAFGGANMPGMDQMMNQMGMYGTSWLPKDPVDIGQTWENSMPIFGDAGKLTSLSTLEAARVPVGRFVASKLRQTINGEFDLGKMMSAIMSATPSGAQTDGAMGMAAQMAGSVGMSGSMVTYFLPDKGKMLKSDGFVSMVMKMKMPQAAVAQGAPAEMNMNIDMNMALLKIK